VETLLKGNCLELFFKEVNMEITAENLEIFFKEIGEKIKESVKNDFPKMRKEFENENPYAVAFETDSDCITLSLLLNTYECLEKRDAYYAKLFAEEGHDDTSKWFPGEWGYSDGNDSGLVKLCDELYEKVSSIWTQVDEQAPHLKPTQNLTHNQLVALHEQAVPISKNINFLNNFLRWLLQFSWN
jgi:hypothetical protein